jgi:RNA polymerase sigma-70 factor (ECF subfamily)
VSPVGIARIHSVDAELIEAIAAGDLNGLGPLFDRYAADVSRLVARLGVHAADVDDLVQNTFLELPRAAARFEPGRSVRVWLFGIAVVMVRRHRRSLARLAAQLGVWAREPRQVSSESPSEKIEQAAGAARARRALDRLSPKKREVFVMVALEQIRGEEVARALGIPVATVWTRLHHARLELRAHLSEDRP